MEQVKREANALHYMFLQRSKAETALRKYVEELLRTRVNLRTSVLVSHLKISNNPVCINARKYGLLP